MEEKTTIKPIDFVQIAKKLWPHRKTYYKVLPAVLFGTYLLLVCIPRYYACSVSLAPEPTGASLNGSLASMASSFGLGGALGKIGSQDAINSEIYPDVLKSKNFIAELMPIQIKTQKGDVHCNYYTYLRDHQKSAWWSKLLGSIAESIAPSPKDSLIGNEKLSVFNLTKKQNNIFNTAQANIHCYVEKKTNVVTITLKDQDPLVCATMADATCRKLQDFIISYRTRKARIDCEYYQKLRDESKANYEKALRDYSVYADAHTSTIMSSYQTKLESLENDMQAKYNIYTAMNTQMEAARAKLQEATPAFTVIETASVPIRPAGPKRLFISVAMMLLSFFVLSGWLLARH